MELPDNSVKENGRGLFPLISGPLYKHCTYHVPSSNSPQYLHFYVYIENESARSWNFVYQYKVNSCV